MNLPDLALRAVADGVRIKLRVLPGARRDAILGPHGDALKVAVRAVPEKGRANEAVERLLATALGVALADVELIAGAAGRDKILQVRGVDATDLRARLLAVAVADRR